MVYQVAVRLGPSPSMSHFYASDTSIPSLGLPSLPCRKSLSFLDLCPLPGSGPGARLDLTEALLLSHGPHLVSGPPTPPSAVPPLSDPLLSLAPLSYEPCSWPHRHLLRVGLKVGILLPLWCDSFWECRPCSGLSSPPGFS